MTETTPPTGNDQLAELFAAEILAFPGRLDAMEHRDEQNARKLAERLAVIAQAQFARRLTES